MTALAVSVNRAFPAYECKSLVRCIVRSVGDCVWLVKSFAYFQWNPYTELHACRMCVWTGWSPSTDNTYQRNSIIAYHSSSRKKRMSHSIDIELVCIKIWAPLITYITFISKRFFLHFIDAFELFWVFGLESFNGILSNSQSVPLYINALSRPQFKLSLSYILFFFYLPMERTKIV